MQIREFLDFNSALGTGHYLWRVGVGENVGHVKFCMCPPH